MAEHRPPLLALTVGEPAGIGPDLAVTLAARGALADTVLIGDPDVLAARARQLGLSLPAIRECARHEAMPGTEHLQVLPAPTAQPVIPGTLDPANASAVMDMLRLAGQGAQSGVFDAIVTAPVHKGVINDAGIPFSGHTEYFAELTGTALPVMMLVADALRVALVTTHLPLRQVADAITAERLEQVIRILVRDLQVKFGLPRPRVLVSGLNPHAGEGGHLGREELEIIQPVLERLRREGVCLDGPLPADTLFTPDNLTQGDAVLAMYHDQGLPVLKHAGFGQAVNVTLGLPIIRTSVDHGTALDLAGGGHARSGSLEAALELARQLVHRSRQAGGAPQARA
ncbi:4-hydroxythreonine-4-phosphate dehydrogenase PdxA [Aquisalimonas sp. 2447]|uniref:4-hydroxythreonine-4-phosphate dehydrogenase PdxA n=1 Tax=Aquisalimonas sp. 2447 TaxID=2740807 RepID=UPI001432604E|nr:4-hydroxythreonine-4-phosphate dehydrogenase PdxA [Aquisalimonas sp. 2447]QIT56456.1 4-hydroxythreonine-4-phosphate dehydrogenase PdxA [Aquisalimonas sp. 2447]